MLKKFLSMLLAVMMVVSVMAVGVVSTGAATTAGFTPEANKLYFDVDGTGWEMGKNDKIAFYMAGGDFDTDANPTKPIDWGGKKLQGTAVAGETGIFEFDPAAKAGYTFTEGVQYKVIFARVSSNNWKEQTCDLFFTTECFGHVGYSDGTEMENNVDSSKKSKTVYWRDMDPAKNGPVLCVTSIGNVVGSCLEQGKTKYDLFVEFVSEAKDDFGGKTGLENARFYTVEQAKTKTEQKMIDDIGAALELTKDEVEEAFTSKNVETAWTAADSDLPGGVHEHTPGEPVRENEVPATCTEEGSYDEVVYCTECGEEISRETKTIEKIAHTPGEPVQENLKPATCTEEGSYDEVVYCTVCNEELSRETKTIEKIAHTPGEAVRENEVPATCTEEGSYDEVVYCTVCNEELSREAKTIDMIPHTLSEVAEVPATEEANGVKAHYECSVCGKKFSDAEGTQEVTDEDLVIPALPHTHVEAAPVIENEVPADCENGGSYDEVIYCSKCGEELNRKTITTDPLGHDLVFVEEVPATASVDGMKAHYECSRCGKLFADATGEVEVTAEDLIIKAAHVRGDADGDGELTIADVTILQRSLAEMPVENFDEIAADADLDGVIDIIDATLIQRVLAEITTFEKWDEAHAA